MMGNAEVSQTRGVDAEESILGRVSQQLSQFEKRDWELWLIVVLVGVLVGAGLLAITLPSVVFQKGDFHFEINVSRQAFVGLVVLLALFNTYVVTRRLELRKMRQRLISSTLQTELVRVQSFMDPLTEVFNRRSLDEMAQRYISHARRSKQSIAFLLVDLDRFKDVNTRFGHLTGDFVIGEVASVLKGSVRGNDAVFRYGGDEFLIILQDTNLEDAANVIDRIGKNVEDWNKVGHLKDFDLRLSIGAAEWHDGKSLDDVLRAADDKMYQAKAHHMAQAAR